MGGLLWFYKKPMYWVKGKCLIRLDGNICIVMLLLDGFMARSQGKMLNNSLTVMMTACFWLEKVSITRETIHSLFGM